MEQIKHILGFVNIHNGTIKHILILNTKDQFESITMQNILFLIVKYHVWKDNLKIPMK
jgi:hypothetical protein